MTPINKFLSLKKMTASNLLQLTDTEEFDFWDEYQQWRQATVNEVAEKIREVAN
jgi:hypothetical protein